MSVEQRLAGVWRGLGRQPVETPLLSSQFGTVWEIVGMVVSAYENAVKNRVGLFGDTPDVVEKRLSVAESLLIALHMELFSLLSSNSFVETSTDPKMTSTATTRVWYRLDMMIRLLLGQCTPEQARGAAEPSVEVPSSVKNFASIIPSKSQQKRMNAYSHAVDSHVSLQLVRQLMKLCEAMPFQELPSSPPVESVTEQSTVITEQVEMENEESHQLPIAHVPPAYDSDDEFFDEPPGGTPQMTVLRPIGAAVSHHLQRPPDSDDEEEEEDYVILTPLAVDTSKSDAISEPEFPTENLTQPTIESSSVDPRESIMETLTKLENRLQRIFGETVKAPSLPFVVVDESLATHTLKPMSTVRYHRVHGPSSAHGDADIKSDQEQEQDIISEFVANGTFGRTMRGLVGGRLAIVKRIPLCTPSSDSLSAWNAAQQKQRELRTAASRNIREQVRAGKGVTLIREENESHLLNSLTSTTTSLMNFATDLTNNLVSAAGISLGVVGNCLEERLANGEDDYETGKKEIKSPFSHTQMGLLSFLDLLRESQEWAQTCAQLAVPYQVWWTKDASALLLVSSPAPLLSLYDAFTDPELSPKARLPLTSMNKVTILLDVATALAFLSRQGISHGRLKDTNVLLYTGGRAKISDFGIVSLLDTQVVHASPGICGVRWLPPEVIFAMDRRKHAMEEERLPIPTACEYALFSNNSGGVNITSAASSDVYALGLLGLVLLTEKQPFHNLRWTEGVRTQILNGAFPSLPSNYPDFQLLSSVAETVVKPAITPWQIRPSLATMISAVENSYISVYRSNAEMEISKWKESAIAVEEEKVDITGRIESWKEQLTQTTSNITRLENARMRAVDAASRRQANAALDAERQRFITCQTELEGLNADLIGVDGDASHLQSLISTATKQATLFDQSILITAKDTRPAAADTIFDHLTMSRYLDLVDIHAYQVHHETVDTVPLIPPNPVNASTARATWNAEALEKTKLLSFISGEPTNPNEESFMETHLQNLFTNLTQIVSSTETLLADKESTISLSTPVNSSVGPSQLSGIDEESEDTYLERPTVLLRDQDSDSEDDDRYSFLRPSNVVNFAETFASRGMRRLHARWFGANTGQVDNLVSGLQLIARSGASLATSLPIYKPGDIIPAFPVTDADKLAVAYVTAACGDWDEAVGRCRLGLGFSEDCLARLVSENITPVHIAAYYGSSQILQLLVDKHNFAVNSLTSVGETALHFACRRGYLRIVRLLVERYSLVPVAENEEGISPITYALCEGFLPIIRYLLEESPRKVPATHVDSRLRASLLHWACLSESVPLVRFLINDHRLSVSALCPHDQSSPLHWATAAAPIAIVKYLIENALADASATNKHGSTCLHFATASGDVEKTQFLIETVKLKLATKDRNHQTPADTASGPIVVFLDERKKKGLVVGSITDHSK